MELFVTMDDVYVGLGVKFTALRELDESLDLPESKVSEMKRNLHSPSQRRGAYLDLYATGHPCPSWRQVAEALSRFHLDRQADTVDSTYVQGTRIRPGKLNSQFIITTRMHFQIFSKNFRFQIVYSNYIWHNYMALWPHLLEI